ncbi:MAG: hypothetical protein OES38_13640, partial [Gammaproteobacteria bacterium]|nr:hypothetical protein [Gammaproteobacteria bacterium]
MATPLSEPSADPSREKEADKDKQPPAEVGDASTLPPAAAGRASESEESVTESSPVAGSIPAADSSAAAGPTEATLADRLPGFQEQLIDLPMLLDDLVKQGFVSQRQAEDILIAPRTKKELTQHPMEIVADREFENRNKPGHKLDLEALTLWLCEKSAQPYLRIDPLDINVNAVTEVMSYAFAQRHNILAVEVSDDEVVIASAQPYMYQWETMLTQTLRGRRIKRVITNPGDLTRYM